MKTYIKPKTIIFMANAVNMLANSDSDMRHICSHNCRFWHSCRDRQDGIVCYDKQY